MQSIKKINSMPTFTMVMKALLCSRRINWDLTLFLEPFTICLLLMKLIIWHSKDKKNTKLVPLLEHGIHSYKLMGKKFMTSLSNYLINLWILNLLCLLILDSEKTWLLLSMVMLTSHKDRKIGESNSKEGTKNWETSSKKINESLISNFSLIFINLNSHS